MAWESSDLILAGVTGAIGLASGQIGGWVQNGRDLRRQLASETAQNERLRLQTDQTNLLDWRSRRVDAYAAVVAASERCKTLATGVSRAKARDEWPTPEDASIAESALLDATGRADLISETRLRALSQHLNESVWLALHAAGELRDANVVFYNAGIEHDIDPSAETVANVESAGRDQDEAKTKFNERRKQLQEAHDTWLQESRARLGLVD